MKVRLTKKNQLAKQRWLTKQPYWLRNLQPMQRDRQGRVEHIIVPVPVEDAVDDTNSLISRMLGYKEDVDLRSLFPAALSVSVTSPPPGRLT